LRQYSEEARLVKESAGHAHAWVGVAEADSRQTAEDVAALRASNLQFEARCRDTQR